MGGTPTRSGQRWYPGIGYPWLGQENKYLLGGGQYASCICIGGLSCFSLFVSPQGGGGVEVPQPGPGEGTLALPHPSSWPGQGQGTPAPPPDQDQNRVPLPSPHTAPFPQPGIGQGTPVSCPLGQDQNRTFPRPPPARTRPQYPHPCLSHPPFGQEMPRTGYGADDGPLAFSGRRTFLSCHVIENNFF